MTESYMDELYISLLLDCPNPPSKRQIYNMKYYYDVVKPKRRLLSLEKKLKYNCVRAEQWASCHSKCEKTKDSYKCYKEACNHIHISLDLLQKICNHPSRESLTSNGKYNLDIDNKIKEIKMCMDILFM